MMIEEKMRKEDEDRKVYETRRNLRIEEKMIIAEKK